MLATEISNILQYCEEFVPGEVAEYFFDHNPDTFGAILEMYRAGSFHIPEGSRSCAFVMRRDFEYWGLDELDLEACCALKYYPQIQVCLLQQEGDEKDARKRQEEEEKDEEKGLARSRLASIRMCLWDFLEKPWSSRMAGHYALFSLSMVILSTATFVVSTAEEMQGSPRAIKIIDWIDLGAVVFFSFEYFTRFLLAPHKLRFFLDKMNLVDLLCLIPFYISLILEELEDVEIIGKAGKIIRFMKVLRIFRVYKLFKHFAGLQSLLYTMQQAYKELWLLLHILGGQSYTHCNVTRQSSYTHYDVTR